MEIVPPWLRKEGYTMPVPAKPPALVTDGSKLWHKPPADFDDSGKFQPGHAAAKKFLGPEEFWEACQRYFAWVEENPLQDTNYHAYRGAVITFEVPKKRVPTLMGLLIYIGVSKRAWAYWKSKADAPFSRPDFHGVIEHIEMLIYEEKFVGAAAGLLNPMIISRDLGLAEKVQSDVRVEAVEFEVVTNNEEVAIYVHPDDTSNGESGFLFTRAQLDREMPFFINKEDAE